MLFMLLAVNFFYAIIIKVRREINVFLLIPSAIYFCTFYVIANDQVAQDRNQYFNWYLNARYILENQDFLFTLILNGLPDRMGAEVFGALFALIIFSLLAVLLFRLAIRRILNFRDIPLVILALMSDRLFIDATLNTSRSTIALMVFLIALTFRNRFFIIILLACAFGLHSRTFSSMAVCLILTAISPKRTAIFNGLVIVGIMLFITRLISDFTISQEGYFLDQWLRVEEISSESVQRGLSRLGALTPSLAVQILIAMIIPWVLLLREYRKRLHSNSDYFNYLNICPGVNFKNYALIILAVCLIIYPDLTLVARFFPIPIVLLLAQAGSFDLKVYVAIKLAVFLFLLPSLI